MILDLINEDDLQGLEMPSHEDCMDSSLELRREFEPRLPGRSVFMPSHEDCVDSSSLDLCSDLVPEAFKHSHLSRPNQIFSVESSSSDEDDSADLNLEPKKDDKYWVDDYDSDDTDFEIIDVSELNTLGNV